MNVTTEQKTTLTIRLTMTDVYNLLKKQGLVPVEFGNAFSAKIGLMPDLPKKSDDMMMIVIIESEIAPNIVLPAMAPTKVADVEP